MRARLLRYRLALKLFMRFSTERLRSCFSCDQTFANRLTIQISCELNRPNFLRIRHRTVLKPSSSVLRWISKLHYAVFKPLACMVMKLEKSASWKKVVLHCFVFLLSVVALRLSLLSRAGMLLHRVALNSSPLRWITNSLFFLRLPVLFYSDLRSHDALRFSSYSMIVCMILSCSDT